MGRLDTYQEISLIRENENKRISIVRSEIDGLCYIREEMRYYNLMIWKQLKEAKISGIPQIYFYQEVEDRLVIIEEYINSPTLDQYILNHPVDPKEARIIILKLCRILKKLHALNPPLIHRDIKPENIFYNGKELYLFDFDISRNLNGDKKQDTVIVGSVGYAAPEQYGFRQSDPRSDIYSLGILFHVLLTGHFPSEVDYHGEYYDVIEKMTQIDPQARPESIQKVEDLLNHRYDLTLPGFRSNRLYNKVIATLAYLFLIYYCGVYIWDQEEMLSTNIGVVVMTLGVSAITIAYVSNYLNCWHHSFFHASEHKGIQIAGIVIEYIILVIGWISVSVIVGILLEVIGL